MENFITAKFSFKIIIIIISITIFTSNLCFAQVPLDSIGVDYSDVSWGDYDNDGNLDILLIGGSDNIGPVSKVYKNKGDETFTEQIQIKLTGVRGGSAAWGDYNNDGNLDILLTGSASTHNLSTDPITKIYKNNGDETFTEQTQIVLQAVTKSSVAWIDFNNDTHLDIIITGFDIAVGYLTKIYKNNGDETFTEIDAGFTDIKGNSVACADFNNDTHIDIIITGFVYGEGYSTKIYKNNGDETFTDIDAGLLGIIPGGSVAWGDFDNDDDIDILISGRAIVNYAYVDTSIIYKNNGDETFTDIEAGLPGLFNSSVAWGDFNNDNYIDVLITGSNNSSEPTKLSVIYKNNNGIGTFTEQTQIKIPCVDNGSVAWADYNKDNYQDFIITGAGTNSRITKLYTNNKSGNFKQKKINFGQFSSVDNILPLKLPNVELGDFNNDNHIDMIVTGRIGSSDYSTKIYRNNGDGKFNDINADIIQASGGAAWGDYNNDGFLDVLVCGSNVTKVYKNNGDETFIEQTQIVLQGVSSSVAWADYNQDNHLDIIVTGYAGTLGYVTKIYKNNGDGTFSENTSAVLQPLANGSLTWCDFNNDTYPDLLIAGDLHPDSYAILYKNNGDETFTNINAGFKQLARSSVAWGDYNKDGNTDLILTGKDDDLNIFSILYKNNGDETFTEQTQIELVGVWAGSVAWVDFDNDNNLDIAFTGIDSSLYTERTFKIYKNNGDETFTEHTNTNIEGVSYGSIDFADFNSDGFQDMFLCGAAYNGAEISISNIYENTGIGNLEKVYYTFPPSIKGIASSVDYDKNGFADIIFTGTNNSSTQISEIYKGTKFNIGKADISIPALTQESSSWADYNNDGFLDLMICGKTPSGIPVTKLLENSSSNKFIDTQIPFAGIYNAEIDWADYNNDGRLDVAICGYTENELITRIYKNTGNNFVETSAVIPAAKYVKWGDYNNDNLYDIIICDNNSNIKVYENKGNDNFELVYNYSEPLIIKDLCFTDYNYDGFNDILVFREKKGYSSDDYSSFSLSYCKNNKDGTFSQPLILDENSVLFDTSGVKKYFNVRDFNADGKPDLLFNYASYNNDPHILIYSNDTIKLETPKLIPTSEGSGVTWADFDNDNDLDFFTAGQYHDGNSRKLFYNNTTVHNTVPDVPTGLNFSCNADTVYISWNAASDNETPIAALTYNCYMYEIGGDTIWHSMSNHATGKRYIEKAGNTEHNTSWFITNLEVEKEYAWSVQTVDNGFLGSQFAPEQTFRLAPAFTLQPINQTVCENGSITFNTATTPADSYQWYRFTATDTILIQNNEYFSNATSSNLTVSNATLDMHGYDLRCAATTVGGLTYSKSAILNVDELILANAGKDTVACDLTEIQLSANLPLNTTGLWTCENQNVTFSDATNPNSSANNIPEDETTTLRWSLTQQNVCGENSDNIIITQYLSYSIYTAPPVPNGEIELCFGSTASYQTEGIGYANSYLWEITPSEAGITTGNDLQTSVQWNENYTGSANIRVKAQNECDFGEWSEVLSINLNPKPDAANIPTGENNVCVNSQSSFSTSGAANADSYSWQIYPQEAGEIGRNSVQITADWQSDFSGTAYIKVKGINQCGEGAWSDSLQIIISSPAASNIIAKSNIMLVCENSGYNYQWYLNNIQIEDANKQYYYNESMNAGNYQVEIEDTKGCSSISEIYTINSGNKSFAKSIQVYPNPAENTTHINIDNNYTGKIVFSITDNLGKVLKTKSIFKEIKQINFNEELIGLKPGIYQFEFIFNNNQKINKQVIVK